MERCCHYYVFIIMLLQYIGFIIEFFSGYQILGFRFSQFDDETLLAEIDMALLEDNYLAVRTRSESYGIY